MKGVLDEGAGKVGVMRALLLQIIQILKDSVGRMEKFMEMIIEHEEAAK